jgi:hypothetical protein
VDREALTGALAGWVLSFEKDELVSAGAKMPIMPVEKDTTP